MALNHICSKYERRQEKKPDISSLETNMKMTLDMGLENGPRILFL